MSRLFHYYLGLIVTAFLVCLAYLLIHKNPPPVRAAPVVYGWKQVSNQSFVIPIGDMYAGYPWPKGSQVRQRLQISSKDPVTIGYVTESALDQLRANQAASGYCVQQHVLSATVECSLDARDQGYIFFIHDESTPLAAGVQMLLSHSQPARNDVSVAYSEYRCWTCGNQQQQ